MVWVPKSLYLQHVRTQSQQVQAEFLSGSIAAGRLAAAAPSAGANIQPTPPILASVHVACATSAQILCPTPSALHRCPSEPAICHVTLPLCPSEAMIHCGASTPAVCFSQAPVFCVPTPTSGVPCMSHHFGCPTMAPAICFPVPTSPVVCGFSQHLHCPTFAPELCVSQHIGCPTSAPFLCVQPTSPGFCPAPTVGGCPSIQCGPGSTGPGDPAGGAAG
jgi:hypothetical protein